MANWRLKILIFAVWAANISELQGFIIVPKSELKQHINANTFSATPRLSCQSFLLHAKTFNSEGSTEKKKKASGNNSPKQSRSHPRNAFRGSYDMEELAAAYPPLAKYLIAGHVSKGGRPTIRFDDPSAVRALNAALLASDYRISRWEEHLPLESLCPPIPGRADYIHHLADTLARSAGTRRIPTGPAIRGVDVGTGASLVYPIIGIQTYGWSFLGTEIDQISVECARNISETNGISDRTTIRLQPDPERILRGVVSDTDGDFEFVMCNPPFYESREAFRKESLRKIRNLAVSARKRGSVRTGKMDGRTVEPDARTGSNNFGGGDTELWYPGGEVAFIRKLIDESYDLADRCLWFTSLVSRRDNASILMKSLTSTTGDNNPRPRVQMTRTVEMGQGQKSSTILMWSFFDEREQRDWYRRRESESTLRS